MYYLIYQIKNKINNKIYIGQHQTENIDDGYMGSGHGIINAIKKARKEYSLHCFEKRILFNLKSFEAMNEMEKILVDEWFVNRKDTYNNITGGQKEDRKGLKCSEETKERMRQSGKVKVFTEEHKNNLSESQKGNKYSLGYKHPKEKGEMHSKLMSGENNPMYGVPSPMKGKKDSEETKKKKSEANKGKPKSEEQILKMKITKTKNRLLANKYPNYAGHTMESDLLFLSTHGY